MVGVVLLLVGECVIERVYKESKNELSLYQFILTSKYLLLRFACNQFILILK